MPQLDLYGESDRRAISWRYSIDPREPDKAPMFYVSVTGHRDLAVEHGLAMVPLNVVHEEVHQLLVATWDAYLFGEVDDVRQACGRVHQQWKHESANRPQL